MAFLLSLPHERIIPTVNVGSETSRARMRAWTDRWTQLSHARRRSGEQLVLPRGAAFW